MDFLKNILGEDLFKQFETAINTWNGNEENKDKQIKVGNIASGEFASMEKVLRLQEELKGKDTELDKANGLITEMKKATKGNEDLQGKITAYEGQVADLQTQLAETKLKSAIKVALLSAKAADVDYLTFKLKEKLKEKGETLELDENDNIKGWDAQLDGLKTQFPNMFESGQKKIVAPNRLPNPEDNITLTKAELLKKPYAERMELYNTNPEAYKAAMES